MKEPKFPIADLHCDLLWYLSLGEKRTANDLAARCAIPQLKKGNVCFQTMAIFVENGNGSAKSAKKQVDIFCDLPHLYPDIFRFHRHTEKVNDQKIEIAAAIENASAICEEGEDLIKALSDFTAVQRKTGRVLYVSLTWNGENRFGGGAHTNIGIKPDGEQLLDYLSEQKIAVDLSHTSDYLAADILNYIERKNLDLPLMASHSNLRSVCDMSRNLPNEFAKEIIRKKGLIGINFVRDFIGRDSSVNFVRQLEELLKLGGEDSMSFGADFFCTEDLPLEMRKPNNGHFFPGYNDSSVYPTVLDLWKKELALTQEMLKKICTGNFFRFLQGG